MKKNYLFAILFLVTIVSHSQDFGGVPVTNAKRIQRVETTEGDTKTVFDKESINSKTLSTTAVSPTGSSSEVGVTEGELSVSLSGGANYSIPISVPPGINGIVPQVNLTYSSQSANGMAGYGWNVAGISAITRIPSTKFHDGIIDPVDFDTMDRFALDGQRLIVKNNGSYGGNGTVYETEAFSNIKITSYGVHPSGANYGPQYFIVEYPDGSKAYYGMNHNQRSLMEWGITSWENPQGVQIKYEYLDITTSLTISNIYYGGMTNQSGMNRINFVYETRNRAEQAYVGGMNSLIDKILKKIQVIGNGIGFRNYILSHDVSSLGYQRLTSVTEVSGDNTKSYNPTVFSYENTPESLSYKSVTSSLSVGNISLQNAATVSGDFDGDGRMDFLVYPTTGAQSKSKYWLFNDVTSGTNPNLGWEHPVGRFDDIFPVTWLNWDNKFMPFQGWTVVKSDSSTNNTTFATYSAGISSPIFFQNEKSYQFPKFIYYDNYNCNGTDPVIQKTSTTTKIAAFNESLPPQQVELDIPKVYLNGDFNGDGLTDAVVVEKSISYYYQDGCYGYSGYRNGGSTYFVNLDRRITSDFVSLSGYLSISDSSKYNVADFNGDGKADIFVFDNGTVKVYSYNSYNYFELVYQNSTSDTDIKLDKPILMGDYNGDGKTDFIVPKAFGYNYALYTSTGSSLVKTNQSYAFNYQQNTSTNTYHLIANDLNNDGKTDILYINTYFDRNANVGSIRVQHYRNMGTTFVSDVSSFTGNKNTIVANPLPIFLTSDKPNQNLEVSFLSNSYIHYFQSLKDFNIDKLLKTITNGNGVTESITYKPLSERSYEGYNSVYASGYNERYPNIDITIAPSFQVVTKLEKQSASVYKKQLYSYYGAVSNLEGIGFLGFRATMKTNWHDDSSTLISSISKYDVNLRGANTENYEVLYWNSPSSNFNPSSYISKSVLTYQSQLSASKVFKIQNTAIDIYNGLEGTSSSKTIVYDAYNNPTQSTSYIKEGATVNQTTITNITYDNQPLGGVYYIGRPTTKTQSVSVPGDLMTSEEMYNYTNHLLTQVKKKGHNTEFLTEDNIYDSYGNITRKTISGTGINRVTNYEYDASRRFLIKSFDVEGLAKTFSYNLNNGVLNSETNPYGLTTTYNYDSWLKKTKTTDYLGKSITYVYSKNAEKSIITSNGDDGSASQETYDDLGRKIISSIKDVNNNYSSVSYLYDIYDRNYKVSERYFGASPSQWNETKYDIYGRVIQNISFTGKNTSISYSGLTTSVNDGTKTKTTIKNALGNVVSMSDSPGGTITYTYFANANLKNSNYEGVVTTIEQNGWGRKTKLIDTSAGTYTYDYNLLGETTKETSPNGNTTYVLDAFGKVIEKTIVGTFTNSKSTYSYDPSSKLISSIQFQDLLAGTSSTNFFEYDGYKRLIKTIETTPYARFTKEVTYDAFGRTDKETSTALVLSSGKSSAKTVKNTYKNGIAWQIIDDANSQVLYQLNETNARGQVTTAAMGNGNIAITNSYDSFGLPSQIKHDRVGVSPGNLMLLTTAFDAQKGNLSSRTNSLFNWNESFQYDSLDRLTSYPNAIGVQVNQSYDARGRITENPIGTYAYSNTEKPYQNNRIDLSAEATGSYDVREGVFCDSFEEKKGWGAIDGTVFSYDTTEKRGAGATSFKIVNTTSNEITRHADVWVKIDNAVATEYTYSAWVKSNNPQAELFLFMKTENETNYFTVVSQEVTNVKNSWVKIEKTVLVPASIKKLNIRLDNNGFGTVWFDDVQIRKTSNGNVVPPKKLDIKYNAFKSPVEIIESNIDKISFVYNDANSRSTMFYGGLEDDKLLRPLRKYYSADGTMEIKENLQLGTVEFVTYLGGDGYSAPVVIKSDGVTQNYLYLHRDYQGTILAISNSIGQVVEKRLFDAWGNIIKVQDGAGMTLNGLTVLDRGYTGHEHLQSVDLIHMNGRLYDPKLHRFLQPDNFVQEPFNTQNYNRYGYVLNNPLKYTDPSGEKWKIKLTWSDLIAGVSIIAGTALAVFGGPAGAALGTKLIAAGATHFLATTAILINSGKSWVEASNYVGFQSPTISINTDWGYNSDDKNGVTQNEPVVKPNSESNNGGNAKADKDSYDSWFYKKQNFAAEASLRVGTYVDFSPIKKFLGITLGEYTESNIKGDYYDYKGSITKSKNHFFEAAIAVVIVGVDYKYNLKESRWESFSLTVYGFNFEWS